MNSKIFEDVILNNVENVRDLLERGVDPNEYEEGAMPIFYARSPEMIDLLLSYGADINAKGEFGWTPLFQAVAFREADIVSHLLKRGADRTIKTEMGETIISFLIERLESANKQIERYLKILKVLGEEDGNQSL